MAPPDPVDQVASLDELERRLDYRFTDIELLDRALRHRSWCGEHEGAASNERLEFLGDAVLGWAVADISFRRFVDVPEGKLTDLRKSVVSEPALAQIAGGIGLGEFLRLGRSEAMSGGDAKPSLLSDAFEAVLAAVYLDGGASAAFAIVERLVAPHLDATAGDVVQLDHKSTLQYLCDRLGLEWPTYTITSSGPPHAQVFTADVAVGGRSVGVGTGGSKKSAEQAAAATACDALG